VENRVGKNKSCQEAHRKRVHKIGVSDKKGVEEQTDREG